MYINNRSQCDIVYVAKRFHIGFYATCKEFVMKCIDAAHLDSWKKHLLVMGLDKSYSARSE